MTPPPDSSFADRLAVLEARCAATGKPLTLQRRAVLEALVAVPDHPTADSLHLYVAERFPGISRATVYRTLDTFVDLGVAGRVPHPGASMRFDPRTDQHHHFLCSACERLQDLENSPKLLDLVSEVPAGAKAESYGILFHGECADCCAGP